MFTYKKIDEPLYLEANAQNFIIGTYYYLDEDCKELYGMLQEINKIPYNRIGLKLTLAQDTFTRNNETLTLILDDKHININLWYKKKFNAHINLNLFD